MADAMAAEAASTADCLGLSCANVFSEIVIASNNTATLASVYSV